MIFTGVTGGEIVSLLYPLFILSPFCYIIISKESLDGSPCGDSVRHDQKSSRKTPVADFTVCIFAVPYALLLPQFVQHFRTEGRMHDYAIVVGQLQG